MSYKDMTIGEFENLKNLLSTQKTEDHPWQIGKNYLVRTVTMIVTGRLISVYTQELVFEDAAWIADTGRFNEALKDQSKFSEVEPFVDDAIVARGSIVDATGIENLPMVVK